MKTNVNAPTRRLALLGLLSAMQWLAPSLQAAPLAYSDGTATAALSAGQWAYYEVTVPPGNAGWRLTLNATGTGNPDLYFQRGTNAPTTDSYLKRSLGEAIDTLTLTEADATPTNYVVGVYLPSGGPVNFTLTSEDHYLTTLAWDPGTADAGTATYTNASSTGGEYFFKLVAENTDLGMWRTALRVTSGEANLYLRSGALPTTTTYDYKSDRTGSDGLVRPYSGGAGQTWYLLVKATAGSQWSLLSGDIFVTDLGALATNTASSSGLSTIPPEGLRYFKTTLSTATLAWRLWLQNAAGIATWNTNIYVRKSLPPHPESSAYYEQNRTGQALLVPPYLVAGGSDASYLAVPGNPGDTFQLDSRQQTITDIAFASTNSNVTLDGFLYRTYRVPVPVQQKAWEVDVAPTSGKPDFALRRSLVPNEFNNDAFSEASGNVTDSATLVPPTLSDGTYYITVYASVPSAFTLANKEPSLHTIAFESTTPNPEPSRNGWVYFQLLDIDSQLGKLGWLLALTNHVSGSEIAIRRNAMPGRWNYRQNGAFGSQGYNEMSTVMDVLVQTNHAADIWYVGVYGAYQALTNFTLTSAEFVPGTPPPPIVTPLPFDGGTVTFSNLPPQNWSYFRVEVPATNNGAPVLGWEVKVSDWAGAKPQMVIQRGFLPNNLQPSTYWYCSSYNCPGYVTWNPYAESLGPGQTSMWPEGQQWVVNTAAQWTGLLNGVGILAPPFYMASMAMDRPLAPGIYYLGLFNNSDMVLTNCTLASRGIGDGLSIPVTPIAYAGGSAGITNLAPRGVAYFVLDMPTNVPTWQIKLEDTVGETELYIRKDRVPTLGAGSAPNSSPAETTTHLNKGGDERFIVTGGPLPTGKYYLMVVSQGQNPWPYIGTNGSSAILRSLGPTPVTDLGTLPVAGTVERPDSYVAGDNRLYTFTVPTNALALEMRLLNRVGYPELAVRNDGTWSRNYRYGLYGSYLGIYTSQGPQYGSWDLVTIANPAGSYNLTVGGYGEDGEYTLQIRTVGASPVAFDGGTSTVTDLAPQNWAYFRVDVPATNNGTSVLGWELKVSGCVGAKPQMVIRRGSLPEGLGYTGYWNGSYMQTWYPTGPTWPEGFQCPVSSAGDWTALNDAGAVVPPSYIVPVAMGRPLEPGIYYIGLYNNSVGVVSNCTLTSRGIGEGLSYPVTPIAYAGGSALITNLAARSVAYYAVDVPTNALTWQIKLENTVGETELFIRKDWMPTFFVESRPNYSPVPYMTHLNKGGDERFILTPEVWEGTLRAGRYYLMVVSQGQNPWPYIGTNGSSAILRSLGPAPVTNLGTLPVAGTVERPDSYVAGDNRLYTFTVPTNALALEMRLLNRVGSPELAVRNDGNWSRTDRYGSYPGIYTYWGPQYANSELVTMASPAPGTYNLTVGGYGEDGEFTLQIRTVGATSIAFDGGTGTVTNLAPQNWTYFRVDVPATNNGAPVLGWELKASDWVGAKPRMVVRRGSLPDNLQTTATWNGAMWVTWGAGAGSWPEGQQWVVNTTFEWTGLNAAENAQPPFYIVSAAMGRPLEPGTYYVGFYNDSANVVTNCTLTSRGIGDGLSYPVTPIAYAGGSALISNLPPREVAYFSVDVPTNVPTWQIKLENTVGETELYLRKDRVPALGAEGSSPSVSPVDLRVMTHLNKGGDERFILTPMWEGIAGRYYLMVVSQGQNPWPYIGSNGSSAILRSLGPAPVTDLGTLPVAGTVERPDSYAAGDNRLYTVAVPPGALALEMRLLNRVGSPLLGVRNDGNWWRTDRNNSYPGSYPGICTDLYRGSQYASWDLVTIPNPTPGTYSLTVGGYGEDGEYTLRIRTLAAPDLNFSSQQNTNGLSNTATGLLADNQRALFKVQIPAQLNGDRVLGWYPTLQSISGSAQFRVRKDLPPEDNNATPFASYQQVLVPPFLTNGVWYVEVKAVGASEFRFASEAIRLEYTWSMPSVGASVTTPGLTAPFFGDTGISTNGSPLPNDQGVDLGVGLYHFYAVDVPTNNGGLFRTELQAINGNPDLHLRQFDAPSIDPYNTNKQAWLNSSGTSEYGNWVVINGCLTKQLTPGRWYLGVKAEGASNCRYRLRLSTGNIQNLVLNGGSFSGQVLAAGDWRYYRVQIPWDAPVNWNVTYNQTQGDVDLYVRDTTPPGDWPTPGFTKDWNSDGKNTTPYPSYSNPGTCTLQTPQLRPGHTYYLGFRANVDTVFSVSSAVSGGTIGDLPVLNCYGGRVTTNIPANSAVTFRIPVPADAVRWQHYTTNAAAVQVWLAQGSPPIPAVYANWGTTTGNGSLSQLLNGWPWVTGESYFITATNTGGTAQPFTLVLDARTTATDDSDNDGLPDAWERPYFGDLRYSGTSDPDSDGNNNLVEFADGTNPNDGNSAKYFLNLIAPHGAVTRNLTVPKYDKGTSVLLTAVPEPGWTFTEWAGTVSGSANPLSVTFSNNVSLTATFTEEMRLVAEAARLAGGALPLHVTGAAGKGIVIEFSTNLVNWISLYTNFSSGNTLDFNDPVGLISPVRFYRARSLPITLAPPTGRAAWWRAENDFLDSAGTNHGYGSSGMVFAEGRVGQGFSFDGSSFVMVPDSLTLRLPDAPFTIATWFKTDSRQSQILFSKGVSDGNEEFSVSVEDNGMIYWDFGGGQSYAETGPGVVPTNRWCHLVVTYNPATTPRGQVYVDGLLRANAYAGSGGHIVNSGAPLYIGTQNAGTPYYGGRSSFQGLIDEVAFFNCALSTVEIQALYAAGSAGLIQLTAAPVITTPPQSVTNVVGGTATFSVVAAGTAPMAYQWRRDGHPLADGDSISGANGNVLTLANLQRADAGNYAVVIANTVGSITSAAAVLVIADLTPVPLPAGCVAWWRGENNFFDSAGANHGYSSNEVTFTTGQVGRSFNFNGTNSFVGLPDAPPLRFGQGDLTVETWIKTPPAATYRALLYKEASSYPYSGIFCYLQPDGTLLFAVSDCGTGGCGWGGSRNGVVSPSRLDDSQFHHVVGVRISTGYLLYVDGQLVATRAEPARNADNSEAVFIGAAGPSGINQAALPFLGQIDELTIYNRALDPGEITAIYNAGIAGKTLAP